MKIRSEKQVRMSKELKNFLDSKKIISRETYDRVIRRLVDFKEEEIQPNCEDIQPQQPGG